jgi:hypothetical protein
MPPDGSHHCIEWYLTKVFSIVVFANTGFHSWEARRTLFLWNIENQCYHCDYWLHWWIGLRLFIKLAQDATWWFSPLRRMSPNKGVLQDEVCQHWISLMGGKKDLVSMKYWTLMLSLWLLIAFMDRVKVIHGVCTGCHLMVFTTSECHLTKVFSIVVFANTGFDSWEARRTLFLWNIENKCCPCDYCWHW